MKGLTKGTIAIALLGLSSQGIADTISINFVENPGNQIFAGGEMIGPLATDSSYWNHNTIPTTGDYVAGTLAGLMDGTGAATAVDVQWLCSNTWYNGDGTGDDEHKLSVGYLDDGDTGNGQGVTVTFTNIPFSTYKVYGLFATDFGTDVVNYDVNGAWALGGDFATTAPIYGRIDDNFLANGEYWTEVDPAGAVVGNYWTAAGSGATCVITGEKRNSSARGCLTAVIIEEFQSDPGAPYCSGDGIAPHTLCPCANSNNGSMGGCDWGDPAFPEGGVLSGFGSDSIAANDTVLIATGVADNFGIFFGADNAVNSGNGNPLNDGLRCAGGALVRLIPPTMASGNQMTLPFPVQTLDTGAAAGATRRYQYWFRTPNGPCGGQANLTNGYEIVWTP